ncbi:lambda-crystallin, partial [Nephila pilipes]
MRDYNRRYAAGIYNVSETLGPVPKMEGKVAEEIHQQLCEKTPLHSLDVRRKWRDERLACLAKLKKSMGD